MKKYAFLLFTLGCLSMIANNIQISNVTLIGQDPSQDFTLVQFDISWENSWRLSIGPSNWDAAWIFIKFRENGGPWEHARLNYVDGTAANDGHTKPSGTTIRTASDHTGCFIYRDVDGSGPVNWTGVQLRWDYGWSNVDDEAMIDIQVFAIEMVYIPQGGFNLCSQSTAHSEVDNLHRRSYNGAWEYQYHVGSESAITVDPVAGLYYTVLQSSVADQSGPIPADFPKGYDAFYVMKYEVSEEQWIGFFNTLTDDQKVYYDITDINGKNTDGLLNRNTISYTSGMATTSAPARALNHVGWNEMSGYLDWSALRPFTELEYEKMARGASSLSTNSVANGYAWGNTSISSVTYILSNDGSENALITNPQPAVGNAIYYSTTSGLDGPMRVGIVAASANTKNREETGASFYGVMELSGNVFERCMSVGTADNRTFTGNHGNGRLYSFSPYRHDVSGWPVYNSAGARSYRGGAHGSTASFLMISDRYLGCHNIDVQSSYTGIRGARTAE